MKFIKRHEQAKKRKGKLPLHIYLAYLLVCTFLLTGVTFSRYISSANGSDSARVAAGVVTVSYDDSTALEMTPPYDYGVEERTFPFRVSNVNSEVAIRYDVVVTLDKPLASGVTMTLDDMECSGNSNNTYTFSNMGILEAGAEEIKEHTLSFKGDFEKIPAGTNDNYQIKISIRSQQID